MDAVFQHRSASWPVLIAYVFLAGWHLAGLRGALAMPPPGTTRRQLRREAAAFQLGLAVIAVALVSPVGYWSTFYLSVLAGQELLAAVVGAGLLVVGSSWAAMRLRRVLLTRTTARPFPLVATGVALLMQWFSNEESAELAAGLEPPGWHRAGKTGHPGQFTGDQRMTRSRRQQCLV